jgi:hypothetical protein
LTVDVVAAPLPPLPLLAAPLPPLPLVAAPLAPLVPPPELLQAG